MFVRTAVSICLLVAAQASASALPGFGVSVDHPPSGARGVDRNSTRSGPAHALSAQGFFAQRRAAPWAGPSRMRESFRRHPDLARRLARIARDRRGAAGGIMHRRAAPWMQTHPRGHGRHAVRPPWTRPGTPMTMRPGPTTRRHAPGIQRRDMIERFMQRYAQRRGPDARPQHRRGNHQQGCAACPRAKTRSRTPGDRNHPEIRRDRAPAGHGHGRDQKHTSQDRRREEPGSRSRRHPEQHRH